MKTKYYKCLIILVLPSFILLSACSKDEDPITPQEQVENESNLDANDGITVEDLKASKGDIGIIIDARNIAKKGILPAIAEVKIDAKEGNYSKTVNLNEFTNIASISYDVDELSDAEFAELKEGVSATINIKDADGKSILTETFSKFSFKENGARLTIKADAIAPKVSRPSFNTDIPYY